MCNSFFSFSHFPDFCSSHCFLWLFFFQIVFILPFAVAHKKETHQVWEFFAQGYRLWKIFKISENSAELFWKMWTSISRPNLGILKRQTKQSGGNRMQKNLVISKKCTLFRVPSKSYGHLKNGLWIRVSVGTRRVQVVSFVDGIYFIDVICFVD